MFIWRRLLSSPPQRRNFFRYVYIPTQKKESVDRVCHILRCYLITYALSGQLPPIRSALQSKVGVFVSSCRLCLKEVFASDNSLWSIKRP